MKILYVLGSFYPAQNGGPNNTVFWGARELARRRVEVTVVSLKDGLSQNDIEEYGLTLGDENKIEGIRAWYFDYGINRYLSFSMFWWLWSNIKRYDMVNLTSVFFPWTWFAALVCIFRRVPFSIAPRGEFEPGAYCFGKKRKSFILRLFLKSLIASARFVLVTSEQEECYSKPYFPKGMTFETVPNYMEIVGRAPRPAAIRLKRDVLYLGRIHPKKGIENLIKAFCLVKPELLGTNRLLIVGTGDKEYMSSLEEQVKASERAASIHFLGHRIGEEKKRIYDEAKVMVLPSYSENFGNVVMEALAHATPVIASRFTPWSSLGKEGCGFWVENDPKSITLALESVLSLEQDDYIAMAEAAHRFVTEYYDIRKYGSGLKRLYESYTS